MKPTRMLNMSLKKVKQDLRMLQYLCIRELINDIANFNRNGFKNKTQYKPDKDGEYPDRYYETKEYYLECVEQLNSEFVRLFCIRYSIDVEDFKKECMFRTKSICEADSWFMSNHKARIHFAGHHQPVPRDFNFQEGDCR